MAGFVVQVDDETAEKLTERYSDERITKELTATLEELANEAPRKQSELRSHMGLDEEPSDDEGNEKSQEQLAEELREFMSPSHPRSKDPRLE